MKININIDKILEYFKGKKIAVLYGGLSDEREISLRSGINVYNALSKFPLDVELIDVDRNIAKTLIDKKIDYVYNTLHGTYGEDGIIQGMLEMLNIGYTGENVLVSALCMNKTKTKEIWKYYGLNVPNFSNLKDILSITNNSIKTTNFSYFFPIVVKQKVNGSSVNVFLINDSKSLTELIPKIDVEEYFIEEYIKGKEVTVGVMKTQEGTITLPILGINPKNNFYDFEAKYTKGMTSFEMPAILDKVTEVKIIDLVKKAYDVLNCSGVCRIDVIINKDGIPYLIENNTQPGMTDTSDIPQMIEEVGIDFSNYVLYILGSKVV